MKQFICLLFIACALVARAADEAQIFLWPNGAPGFEERRNEPERAESYWVRNIHNPSITVFLPPREKANGAAVLICPGGGHKELVFKAEGVEAAQYFNSIGVTAFALKYRLGREEGSPYSVTKNAREDGQRAMRVIRSRAVEFGIDTNRLGIVGFSAGGEVASMVVFNPTDGDPNAADPVDRLSCRPEFQIMIYPGGMGMPETIPTNAPPAFFLAANDDQGPARLIASILPKYRSAKVPIEVHLFSKGGHAFNMGNRSRLITLKTWPDRVTAWMADNSLLDHPAIQTDAVR
jgi:acetyl esterase/lipase